MKPDLSITRRLAATVLVLELLSGVVLIGSIAVHERRTQLKSFDATLQAASQAILGSVQDAEDKDDNVMLDSRGLQIPSNVIFRVEDEFGRILGQQGAVPTIVQGGEQPLFQMREIGNRSYRFLILHGIRYVDPGDQGGGKRHAITILYGAPVGHVWYEVWEAIRFVAIATAILLAITALLIVWLMRKGLSPVYELAREAERIHSNGWHFEAPESARRTVELSPLAAALEAAMRRVELSFDQQKRFTSDAAHELKTDVAIIKSSLQLLSMRKRTVEEYDRGLSLLLDDFTRLESSVQKMLTLARLEQPIQQSLPGAPPPSCLLDEVMEEAVYQTAAFAELRSVEVVTSYISDAMIALDRSDALLLCFNVLLNALQHSPEGGRVTVDVHYEDRVAHLVIQDQGEGISEEDRPYLFEPFYRRDPSRSRKSGGTGLGLSICKAICTRIDGKIDIANGPSDGARVTIDLPARPAL